MTEPADSSLSAVEALASSHDPSRFDCGTPALNEWLQRFAWANQAAESARTYVVHRAGCVVGYFSLAAGSVTRAETPARIAKGLARHPIPVIVLARLAVDRRVLRKGLGKALLKEALLRIEQAADIVGGRAVLVHAIDGDAARFYEHFGFERSPVDARVFMLLMKDLRAAVREARSPHGGVSAENP